jgi:hypothetical protein
VRPQVAGAGEGHHIHRTPENILNKQSPTIEKGWSYVLRVIDRNRPNMLENAL